MKSNSNDLVYRRILSEEAIGYQLLVVMTKTRIRNEKASWDILFVVSFFISRKLYLEVCVNVYNVNEYYIIFVLTKHDKSYINCTNKYFI